MHFDLVDRVIERSEGRIVTIKHVSSAEEYLQDHFPTFPVLPGVMMLEAMVQAGRRLCDSPRESVPLVLGKVRALKYGRFVKPGATLRVEIERLKDPGDGMFDLRGEVTVLDPADRPGDSTKPASAASGRFTLRPARVDAR
jgi:3-hydroxyacyl-[acyl-carrier-protein] dehydratase